MTERPDSDLSIYSNISSFVGLALGCELTESVDAVVTGIPCDLTTSGRPGAVASLRHAYKKHQIRDGHTDKTLAGGDHLE
ncbi:MAG: hypothetical protein AAGI44_13990 [Pseudomonadota bacterium]